MAKNKIGIDFNGFAEYAEKIDSLGGNLRRIFADAMEQIAEEVQADTLDALATANLPAKGTYSHGQTKESLVEPRVDWSGSIAEVPLGFDFTKPGAGGWLITGTPRMQPDAALNKIYRNNSYWRKHQKTIEQLFAQEVKRIMGG